MKPVLPIEFRLTQSEVDAGAADSLSGVRITVVDSNNQPTGKVYESGTSGQSPTELVTGSNINTVLSAAGGAGWNKVQATTANYAITRPTTGAGLDLHIESGGSLAAITSISWPVPANGVDQLRIRNFSGSAKTLTAGTGWTIVTADGNPVTGGSYSIPDDRAIEVTLDPDGFAQVVPWGGEVSEATFNVHTGNVSNPHSVTAAQLNLGNVNNTSDVNKPVSTAQQTALNLKQDASTAATDAELTAHTGNVSNPHAVTKTQVGLGSAENTTDLLKPISTATQSALDGKSAGIANNNLTDNTFTILSTGKYKINQTLNFGGSGSPTTVSVKVKVNGTAISTTSTTTTGGATNNTYSADSDLASGDIVSFTTQPANASQKIDSKTASIQDTSGTKTLSSMASTTVQLLAASEENADYLTGSSNTIATPTAATTTVNGLMSSTDKTKLDGVATGANNTVINNTLTSTSTTEALSAAQGKALQDGKQATLVSGTNIKTLNSQNVLGAGNLLVGASTASVTTNSDGTGGTVAQVGNDRTHTFTANGNFVVPTGISAVRVLVIAGGGGGGSGRYRGDVAGRPGGGGGAGGLIHNTSFAVTPGATIAVTVGTGGAGATDTSDADAGTGGLVGGNSTFGTLTAHGGGGGGGHHETNSNPWDVPADQGGSGGGASNGSSGATQSAAASAAGNTGFSGGNGVLVGNNSAGGGGGGAGGAGGNGNGTTGAAGAGGIGLANDITGTSVTYAIGGAGSHVISTGHAGANATAIGGGGEGSYDGGSGGTASALAAGAGASGVVIVRYLYQSLDTPIYANNAAAITGGLTLGMLYRTGVDPDTLCVVH